MSSSPEEKTVIEKIIRQEQIFDLFQFFVTDRCCLIYVMLPYITQLSALNVCRTFSRRSMHNC